MALIDTLNIRRDEVFSVSLLVFQSFFLGVFLGAFDVAANTLFLNNFEQSMISKAFVVSGLIGIILTSIYSYLQARLTFSKLAAINLTAVAIITFSLRAGYYFAETKWLAFGLFVLMGPLNIVALVGFWGTVTRIFDIRQGKRIYGFIDTGQVIGVIISSFSVPFLISVGFKTNNLLYISSISIFIALLIQFFISSKYVDKVNSIVVKTKKTTFKETMGISYVRTMAFFVILSMLVAFFIHYLFLAVASQRFENPDDLAKFFGVLMGSLTFVSILLKAFVYGPLMRTYGLKVSLLISPIVMTLVTAASAILGSTFGYTVESASFTFFFLLISLGKFFQKALKDSIESPVLKLIYQSLSPNIRYEVQARVDGTINEFAALASGVILTLLGLWGYITIIHYIYFLIGIIIIWFVVSFRLFFGYRRTLQQTLEMAAKKDNVSVQSPWDAHLSSLNLSYRLSIAETAKPWLLSGILEKELSLSGTESLEITCEYIKKIAEVSLIPKLENRLNRGNESEAKVITQTLAYLNKLRTAGNDPTELSRLISSKDFNDRVYASKCIWASGSVEAKKNLTLLFRDLVPAVKKQAIWASRGSRSKEIVNFLVDFLEKDEYAPLAHAALFDSSEIGLELIEMGFNRSMVSDTFRVRTLLSIPNTGSAIAERSLFEKLNLKSPFRDIVLNSLLRLNFLADDRDNMKVHQLLVEQAGICAWNLNAVYFCPNSQPFELLKNELEHEFNASRVVLFNLLKTIYAKSSIDAVVENIETGTGESISFALELLDTFIDEDIKSYISPLLEDTGLANRIWALQNYFPLKSYTTEELLKAILNRNQNLIGKTTKIIALTAFKNINDLSLSADLLAQLFNTDKVLSELSARIVEDLSELEFNRVRQRFSNKHRADLERATQLSIESGKDVLERFLYFSSRFSREEALFWLYNSSPITVSNENILELPVFQNKNHLILIENGGVTITSNSSAGEVFSEGETFFTSNGRKSQAQIVADNNTTIHYIDTHKLKTNILDIEFLSKYFNYELIDFFNTKHIRV